MRSNKKVLICDLDNTLYDWVSYFVPSFYAMVDEIQKITQLNRDVILDDFRDVHVKHHNSEYPFAALELNSIKKLYFDKNKTDILKILDPAFHRFNQKRKQTLKVYPGVIETLTMLKADGMKIVAHTDSQLELAADRLSRLQIEPYIDKLYCLEASPSAHPQPHSLRSAKSKISIPIIELPREEAKPNPALIYEIANLESVMIDHVAYVGDSLPKDIAMAKSAGVFCIWAKYGTRHDLGYYDALVRISHWTQEDVKREKALAENARGILPDFVAENGFKDVLAGLVGPSNKALSQVHNVI